MPRPRLHADTIEALDELATRNESYDTIIWRLLVDAGHVDPEEEFLDAQKDEDLDLEEDPSLLDRFWAWFTEGREEVLEE